MQQMLRVLHRTEATYYSQHGRFGRLDEIFPLLNGQGSLVVDKIVRGKHTYEMLPMTDAELHDGFSIRGLRNISDNLLDSYSIDATGEVTQLFP